MTTLTGLAREAMTLRTQRTPPPAAKVIDLADRITEYAAALRDAGGPLLDERTYRNLLVQTARNLDPRCPADVAHALAVIDSARTTLARRHPDPAPPYHRWAANEDPDVRPLGLRDRCLDCGAIRYDDLVEAKAIPAERRALAERRNATALAPCPGPGGSR